MDLEPLCSENRVTNVFKSWLVRDICAYFDDLSRGWLISASCMVIFVPPTPSILFTVFPKERIPVNCAGALWREPLDKNVCPQKVPCWDFRWAAKMLYVSLSMHFESKVFEFRINAQFLRRCLFRRCFWGCVFAAFSPAGQDSSEDRLQMSSLKKVSASTLPRFVWSV